MSVASAASPRSAPAPETAAPGPDPARRAGGGLPARVAASILFLPLFVWITWKGGIAYLLFVEAVVALGVREAVGLFGRLGYRARRFALYPVALSLPLAASAGGGVAFLLVAAATVLVFAETIVSRRARPLTSALGGTIFPLIYPAFFSLFLVLLRENTIGFRGAPGADAGAGAIFFLFLTTWGCDTFAYFTGRAFGKRRLAPSVSPKKTWEGAAGGFVFATAAGAASAGPLLGLSAPLGGLLGALLAVTGQIGDLAESALKREADAKDSGASIPGHGGVLDRFDSVLFNAPILYGILMLIERL